jgi:predicted AlkP superfamily phosphohydrolase/phosphomutase
VSPSLLRRWATAGKMPATRALMERGISGPVRGVDGFYIGSTWPSFYTGLGPASHGFYRIEQLEPGTYGFFRPLETPMGVGGTPFWRVASDAGCRVAVLDVPLTRLDRNLNGVQIVEWGGHDSVFGFQTSPPELTDEIRTSFGDYPLPGNCDARRTTAKDFEQFVTALERAVTAKTALTLELLERDDWSLFVQVFTEAHCAGHQCWHLHDPRHPAHDPRSLVGARDPLERVYRAIDEGVGAIVSRAADATIILFAAHGMSGYRGAGFLLPEILYRLGVTARPEGTPSSRGTRDRVVAMAGATWRRLPAPARGSLRPLRTMFAGRPSAVLRSVCDEADVQHSRCFPIPNGSPVGGIRLNVVGREPHGVLEAGIAADAFCEELAPELLAIIDERTGLPLIKAVHRTDSLYLGERRDALPDILVEWNDAVFTGTTAYANGSGATVRARSETIGVVEGRNEYVRTGEHVQTGIFVCAGPGISFAERERPVRVTDFYPTVCSLLGLSAPRLEGDAIAEIAGQRAT